MSKDGDQAFEERDQDDIISYEEWDEFDQWGDNDDLSGLTDGFHVDTDMDIYDPLDFNIDPSDGGYLDDIFEAVDNDDDDYEDQY